MARKSSVRKADPEVRELIDSLIADGGYTLDEIKTALRERFPGKQHPSRTALGRYAQSVEKIGERMRQSREVAQVWADKLGRDPQSETAKGVLELLRMLSFEVTHDIVEGKIEAGPKELSTLALVMQRIETAARQDLKREQELRAAYLAEVDRKLSEMEDSAESGAFDEATLKRVREEIYGLTG